jgi:thioester reductase-like protein
MGCDWRLVSGTDDVFELFAVRKDAKHPGTAGVFYTFPDLLEWSTRDLYRPHPSRPGHWAYYGRVDNIIVFSNGEKLNPVTIEDIVSGHPAVKGAMVVGHGRFQAALLLEPVTTPATAGAITKFIEDVWPLIQKANAGSVGHGRISKDLVTVASEDKPFPRAGKGTIQRRLTTELYKDEIDKLYEAPVRLPSTWSTTVDLSSEETLLTAIQDLLVYLGGPAIEPDTDFFNAGIDSLQVMNAARYLRSLLDASGVHADISPATLYSHPTPRQLATHLRSSTLSDSPLDDIRQMEDIIAQHTKNPLPLIPDRPDPETRGQTVLLTGSTGSLGSHLLAALLASPNVSHVACLNRDADGGLARTLARLPRHLATSKASFHPADLSAPLLALPPPTYSSLRASLDRVVHAAWPVNFHLAPAAFAPHVAGARALLDLAAGARKRAPLVFVSSRGAVERSPAVPVPEGPARLGVAAPLGGYALAKAAASRVLDVVGAAAGVPCATVRVGQIAGPRAGGREGAAAWKEEEFLPSLVRSSVYLGVLPRDMGSNSVVDWVAVEDVADVLLEIAGVTAPVPADEIDGYFHITNPRTVSWEVLAEAVMEHYGGRIRRLVGFEEWIKTLEQSAMFGEEEKNPAVKLLDVYTGFLQAGKTRGGPMLLSTERTQGHSATLRSLKPITPELMKQWCQQWAF